jgi:hypothetical protein
MSRVLNKSDKLKGDEVVRHAQGATDATLSVLIQPDLPRRRVSLTRTNPRNTGEHWSSRSLAIAPSSSDDRKTIEQTAQFLCKLLHKDVPWLESARTFVAEVTPDELRQVAEHPNIKAVWHNRDVHLT